MTSYFKWEQCKAIGFTKERKTITLGFSCFSQPDTTSPRLLYLLYKYKKTAFLNTLWNAFLKAAFFLERCITFLDTASSYFSYMKIYLNEGSFKYSWLSGIISKKYEYSFPYYHWCPCHLRALSENINIIISSWRFSLRKKSFFIYLKQLIIKYYNKLFQSYSNMLWKYHPNGTLFWKELLPLSVDVKHFWNLSLNRALDLELLYSLVLCFINLYDLDWVLNCLESPFSNLQNETDANS